MIIFNFPLNKKTVTILIHLIKFNFTIFYNYLNCGNNLRKIFTDKKKIRLY